MPRKPPGDGADWASAEADTRLFAAYGEAVARLKGFTEAQARESARKYADHRRADALAEEVAQESLRCYLDLEKNLLAVKNPRAYMAAVVRRVFASAMSPGLVAIDEVEETRYCECEMLEDRDQLLDAAAVLEGWLDHQGDRGGVLLTELRREMAQPGCDLAEIMPVLAERAGLGERAARQELALLMRDLSVRVGDPGRPARWHRQRQDRGYLRPLAELIRMLVERGERAELFNIRRHERLMAADGARVRFRDGSTEEREAPLANVSEMGLAFVLPHDGGECLAFESPENEDRRAVFVVIPPPDTGRVAGAVPGTVVGILQRDEGLTCRVHLSEPLDSEMLRCLSAGAD